MPNWCENTLTLTGPADVQALIDRIAGPAHARDGSTQAVDFGRIVPYPTEYAAQDEAAFAYCEAHTDALVAAGLASRTVHNTVAYAQGEAATAERRDFDARYAEIHGHQPTQDGGMGWRLDNWGTKWNAVYVERWDVSANTITGLTTAWVVFSTAWTPPRPVIKALAAMAPKGVTVQLVSHEPANGIHFRRTWVGKAKAA